MVADLDTISSSMARHLTPKDFPHSSPSLTSIVGEEIGSFVFGAMAGLLYPQLGADARADIHIQDSNPQFRQLIDDGINMPPHLPLRMRYAELAGFYPVFLGISLNFGMNASEPIGYIPVAILAYSAFVNSMLTREQRQKQEERATQLAPTKKF